MTEGFTETVTSAPSGSRERYRVAWPNLSRPLESTQETCTMSRWTLFGLTTCADAMEYSRRLSGEINLSSSWNSG